jgi:hypothetical protein
VGGMGSVRVKGMRRGGVCWGYEQKLEDLRGDGCDVDDSLPLFLGHKSMRLAGIFSVSHINHARATIIVALADSRSRDTLRCPHSVNCRQTV